MDSKCNRDSVIKLLSQAKEEEQRNTEQSLELSFEAQELAKKCNFKPEIAESYVRIGRCYWINGAFDKAIKSLKQGYDLSIDSNQDYIKTEALIGLGNVYITMGLTDQAEQYYTEALTTARADRFIDLESKIYNNVGTLHEGLKNFDVALDFYLKSLKKALDSHDNFGAAIARFNIGNMYLNMDKISQSLEYINQSLAYAEENEKTILLAHCLLALGMYYQKTNSISNSIKTLNNSLTKAIESKDLFVQVQICLELAKSYDKNNDYKKADECFDKSYQLANELGVVEELPKIHEQRAKFYEKHDKDTLAYKHYKAYQEASKLVEENRRLERIKAIEVQSKLKESMRATDNYRSMSNDIKRSYNQMHVLSEIGQSITKTLNISVIFEQLYEHANKLMDAHVLGVGLLDKKTQSIHFDLYIEKGVYHKSFALSLNSKNSYAVYSVLHEKTLRINDAEKEYVHYIEEVMHRTNKLAETNKMHSAMYVPLMIENETIGVLTVQSESKNSYTDMQQDLVETLSSYLAIAIKNAQKSKELAALKDEFKHLSEHDGLTGVPNRRFFNTMYNKLWENSLDKAEPLSLIIADIDNFKRINDTHGHLIGDDVLQVIADELNIVTKQHEAFLARYGGDEFVMLFPSKTENEVKQIANAMKERVRKVNKHFSVSEKITASFGVATTLPSEESNKDMFLSLADNQLYKSKGAGKDTVHSIFWQ